MKKILILNHYSDNDAKRIYGSVLDMEGFIYSYCYKTVISPRALLDKESPDIVLTSLEWLPYQRLVIAEANRRNIPTIYVMDGVLEWAYVWNNHSYVIPNGTMLQPLLSKYITVIGKHPARILSAMGMSEKIHIIGLPRLDNFSRSKTVKLDKKPQLLICSANTPYHNKEQEIMVKRSLMDLKIELEALEDYVDVVWRISDELSSYIEVKNSKGRSLIEILKSSSAVISFNSTIILEAMLLSIPTALIEYRNVPIYLQTAWQIRCKEHIIPTIRELIHSPAEKIAYQDFCLDDELDCDGASERLSDLIRRIIFDDINNSCNVESKNTNGKLDFKKIHSQMSIFSLHNSDEVKYELDGYMQHCENIRKSNIELYQAIHSNFFIRIILKIPFFPFRRLLNKLIAHLEYTTSMNSRK